MIMTRYDLQNDQYVLVENGVDLGIIFQGESRIITFSDHFDYLSAEFPQHTVQDGGDSESVFDLLDSKVLRESDPVIPPKSVELWISDRD